MALFGLFKKQSSANKAKKRLTMVLSYERKGLPTNFAEILQQDLMTVFSKYPQFDFANIAVELKAEENKDELYVSIPFNKQ